MSHNYNDIATRSLPKSAEALQRAAENNTRIAESYGKCDYNSPWAGYHSARSDACLDKLERLPLGGEA